MKTEIRQEDSYDGRPDSPIWFRARTNCLALGDTDCFMCREGLEDFRHFILDCVTLEGVRGGLVGLQRPRLEDWRQVVGEMLYGEEARTK